MKLTILQTSDIHGYLTKESLLFKGKEEAYGYSRTATAIKRLRQEAEGPVLYIETGDSLEGSPYANYFAEHKEDPSAITKAYNALGLDLFIPGNHDFNYGQAYLKEALSQLKADIVCSNVVDDDGHPVIGQPYIIYDYEGYKVGILGFVTTTVSVWEKPENIKGLHFLSALEMAKKYLPEMQEKCDLILLGYHGGFENDLKTGVRTEPQFGENEGYEILNSGLAFDAFFTGHQHRYINETYQGIPCLQPGTKGAALSHVVFDLSREDNGKVQKEVVISELLDCTKEEEDSEFFKVIEPYQQEVQEFLDTSIGTSDGSFHIEDVFEAQVHGHPYYTLVNKVEMEELGVDIAATAQFSLEADGIGKDITLRDLRRNYPYPNNLSLVELTGKELKQVLEFNAGYFEKDDQGQLTANPRFFKPKMMIYNYDIYSGLEFDVDASKPHDERISNLLYHGKPVQKDKIYRIAMNQYRAQGGGNFPVLGKDHIVETREVNIVDLLESYIRQHSPLEKFDLPTFKLI